MLTVISPAKKLDFSPADAELPATGRQLTSDTAELSQVTKALSVAQLKQLMDLSDSLAELTHQRFQAFDPKGDGESAKQAVLAFAGDVYAGLDASSLSVDDLAFAQDHLRILSGLYGLLRPLDRIQPYRLEMGTRIKSARGDTLYAFWRERLTATVKETLANHDTPALINLASDEYSKAVDLKKLGVTVITPVFKEITGGKAKVMFPYAKHARGLMARYIIENRVDDPKDLRGFSLGDYRFDGGLSDEATLVFTRPKPEPKSKRAA